jgi:4-aminobutyrate aminotransferase-like enzyme
LSLRRSPFIAHVRGEQNGMVWGVETRDYDGRTASEWAHQIVLNCYLGNGPVGIHLLGPLASKVIRISPPITITPDEASEAFDIFKQSLERMLHVRHLVDLAHSFSV